jgi:hypothetical protein
MQWIQRIDTKYGLYVDLKLHNVAPRQSKHKARHRYCNFGKLLYISWAFQSYVEHQHLTTNPPDHQKCYTYHWRGTPLARWPTMQLYTCTHQPTSFKWLPHPSVTHSWQKKHCRIWKTIWHIQYMCIHIQYVCQNVGSTTHMASPTNQTRQTYIAHQLY